MRIATLATMGLVIAWAVAHFIAAIFICKPVQGHWDLRYAAEAQCGDQMMFFQSGLSINVVLDFIVIVLPLCKSTKLWLLFQGYENVEPAANFVDTIWNLNMRTSDKIGLSLTFSIGIGMTIVGIIRAIYVTTTSMTGDVTHTLPTNLFLTVIEQQLAIITISIPMLRPLWRRYRARFGGYSLEESEKATGGSGYKRNLPNGTFGGSGGPGKNSRRREEDDTILSTKFELRTVSNRTDIKGPDAADSRSMSSGGPEWDGADSGSETRLGGAKKGSVINVREEWKVSVA